MGIMRTQTVNKNGQNTQTYIIQYTHIHADTDPWGIHKIIKSYVKFFYKNSNNCLTYRMISSGERSIGFLDFLFIS